MPGEIFSADSKPPASPGATAINRDFYDALWSNAYLQCPERFNTWPVVSELLPLVAARLEIGPGLRPRLPIAGTHFIDICEPVMRLRWSIEVDGAANIPDDGPTILVSNQRFGCSEPFVLAHAVRSR